MLKKISVGKANLSVSANRLELECINVETARDLAFAMLSMLNEPERYNLSRDKIPEFKNGNFSWDKNYARLKNNTGYELLFMGGITHTQIKANFDHLSKNYTTKELFESYCKNVLDVVPTISDV